VTAIRARTQTFGDSGWRRCIRRSANARKYRDYSGERGNYKYAAIWGAKELARLSELPIFELRGEWRRLHRMPPPMRLSRDLLVRGITYKLQERAYGGLSTATARKLEQAGADSQSRGAAKPVQPI